MGNKIGHGVQSLVNATGTALKSAVKLTSGGKLLGNLSGTSFFCGK
ncbi:MAG: hypothetical protein M3Y53_07490 [Thermoproteota archaeon]|nr:hypothetical protein [Thermoproteota archaeon]